MKGLSLVPITLTDAHAFVAEHHRHHRPSRGGLFAVACAIAEDVVGVAVVGRPVARGLQDGWTVEVTRLATDAPTLDELDRAYLAGAIFRARERGRRGLVFAAECLDALRRAPFACACSMLYAAAWRSARALGYRKLVTYTLAEEGGASLRAAGWRVVGEVDGRSWSCKSRPRVDRHPTQNKIRWEVA